MADLYRSGHHASSVRRWCELRLSEWTVDHTAHRLETSLGPTHVVEAGSGAATVLVLPGTSFNAATSLPWTGDLARTYRLLVADLPGQPGLSAATRPREEVSGYATWLGELVTWAGAAGGAVVVVGHSRGAAVALTADPARTQGIVLLSPAGLVGVRPGPRLLRAAVPWMVSRDDASSRRLLDLMAGPGTPGPDQLVEWMTLVAAGTRTTGAPGPLPDEVVTRWRAGNVRVLVGEHDCFFPPPRLGAATIRVLAVTPRVVGGAGHLLPDQRPDVVVAAVDDALAAT